MYCLTIVYETCSNGYRDGALDVMSLLSIFSGIFVIISKNPVVSVLFLIGLFLCIACYLLILGINFIGLSYLLVYVGAVSILFLFILMLINIRVSELLSSTSNSIPLAIVIGVLFNSTVSQILPLNFSSFDKYIVNSNFFEYLLKLFSFLALHAPHDDVSYSSNEKIMFVTSKLWDGSLAEMTHIASIGNIMYSSYCIWLIETSIILLLAMVGAIIITIKQKD